MGTVIQVTVSEDSEARYERLADLADDMAKGGCSGEELHYFQLAINYEFEYKSMYHAEAEGARKEGKVPETMAFWALKRLSSSSFQDVDELPELEARVRALGKMAGLSYDEIVGITSRAWRSTPRGSATRGGESSGQVRSSQFSTPQQTETAQSVGRMVPIPLLRVPGTRASSSSGR